VIIECVAMTTVNQLSKLILHSMKEMKHAGLESRLIARLLKCEDRTISEVN
jgi:hypothetical protein